MVIWWVRFGCSTLAFFLVWIWMDHSRTWQLSLHLCTPGTPSNFGLVSGSKDSPWITQFVSRVLNYVCYSFQFLTAYLGITVVHILFDLFIYLTCIGTCERMHSFSSPSLSNEINTLDSEFTTFKKIADFYDLLLWSIWLLFVCKIWTSQCSHEKFLLVISDMPAFRNIEYDGFEWTKEHLLLIEKSDQIGQR